MKKTSIKILVLITLVLIAVGCFISIVTEKEDNNITITYDETENLSRTLKTSNISAYNDDFRTDYASLINTRSVDGGEVYSLWSIALQMEDCLTDDFIFPYLEGVVLDGFFVLENNRPITPYCIKLITQDYVTLKDGKCESVSRTALLCVISESDLEKLCEYNVKAFNLEDDEMDKSLVHLPMKISCKDIKRSKKVIEDSFK